MSSIFCVQSNQPVRSPINMTASGRLMMAAATADVSKTSLNVPMCVPHVVDHAPSQYVFQPIHPANITEVTIMTHGFAPVVVVISQTLIVVS